VAYQPFLSGPRDPGCDPCGLDLTLHRKILPQRTDDSGEEALNKHEKYDWSKSDIPAEYGMQGIPSIFLIGPDGKIIARICAARN